MAEEKKKGASPVMVANESTRERTSMSFGDILKALTPGDIRARRLGWEADNIDSYITIVGENLSVFVKGKMHILNVTIGDIINDDWIII